MGGEVLTLFTTAKPFRDQMDVSQRNALKSWKLLHSDVEVILFGDEEGAADVCDEFGLHHEPSVERHQSGMKYLNYLFERAQAIARHEYLCYANCDIVLLEDFYRAFLKASGWRKHFLMIGQRWDADITKPINFMDSKWDSDLRLYVQKTGSRQAMHYIDYFTFCRGTYDGMPPFLLGRSWWDHWLIWKALSQDVPVIDCSSVVMAVHQNHPHTYHPQGKQGTHEDVLAEQNKQLAGDGRHLRIIADSTHILVGRGVIRRALPFRKFLVWTLPKLWKFLIFRTFWLRKPLGLRRENLSKLARKLR